MTDDEAVDLLKQNVSSRLPIRRRECGVALSTLRFPPGHGCAGPRIAGRLGWLHALRTLPDRQLREALTRALRRVSTPSNGWQWPREVRDECPAPVLGPTLAHWRAVRQQLEKLFGLNGHPHGPFSLSSIPRFTLRWDDPAIPESAHGAMYEDSQGLCIIALRSTEPPADCARTLVHELQHVADLQDFLAGAITEQEMEARAEITAMLFAPNGARLRRLVELEDFERERRLQRAKQCA